MWTLSVSAIELSSSIGKEEFLYFLATLYCGALVQLCKSTCNKFPGNPGRVGVK